MPINHYYCHLCFNGCSSREPGLVSSSSSQFTSSSCPRTEHLEHKWHRILHARCDALPVTQQYQINQSTKMNIHRVRVVPTTAYLQCKCLQTIQFLQHA